MVIGGFWDSASVQGEHLRCCSGREPATYSPLEGENQSRAPIGYVDNCDLHLAVAVSVTVRYTGLVIHH